MVNWTNTMATGLAARRGFMTSQPSRTVVRRGGGGSGNRMHISDRQELQEQMLESGRIKNKQAKADVEMTKATTKNLLPPDKTPEEQEIGIESKKLDNIKKGLGIVSGYSSAVTKDNYDDFYSWIDEADYLPSGTFKTPVEVRQMSPLEFAAYKSEIQGYGKTDDRTAQQIAEAKRKEDEFNAEQSLEKNKLEKEMESEKAEDAQNYLEWVEKTYGNNYPESIIPTVENAINTLNKRQGAEEDFEMAGSEEELVEEESVEEEPVGGRITPEEVAEATGPGSNIKQTLNNTVGALISGELYPEAESARNKIHIVNQKLKEHLRVSRAGSNFDIKNIEKMLPIPSTFWSDPDSAITKYRNIYSSIDSTIKAKEKLLEGGISKSQRNQYEDDINNLNIALQYLPDMEAMGGGQDLNAMTTEEILSVDPNTLSPEEKDALNKRVEELLGE